MIFSKLKFSAALVVALVVVSCGGSEKVTQVGEYGLRNEGDSLAYIIGLSMAQNLLQVDSMVNLEAVSLAIAHAARGEARLSEDDARTAYLKYMLYLEPQRRRAYEERYLAELVKSRTELAQSKSGLAFHITKSGDEKQKPNASTDWVEYTYTISRIDGEVVTEDQKGSLSFEDAPEGVRESLKLIGADGEIEVWMPSKLAYADKGDEGLKIAPFETLRYDIKLKSVEKSTVEKNRARKLKF